MLLYLYIHIIHTQTVHCGIQSCVGPQYNSANTAHFTSVNIQGVPLLNTHKLAVTVYCMPYGIPYLHPAFTC